MFNTRLKFVVRLFAAAGLLTLASNISAAYHNQLIGEIQVDQRPCVFFWLTGVSQPNSAISSDHWFALAKSNANYQEMISELISAKLTSRQVYVDTDGTASCGYATAVLIGLDQ